MWPSCSESPSVLLMGVLGYKPRPSTRLEWFNILEVINGVNHKIHNPLMTPFQRCSKMKHFMVEYGRLGLV